MLGWKLDLGRNRQSQDSASAQQRIPFALAGTSPFENYPAAIGPDGLATLPGWSIPALFARIPRDLARLVSDEPDNAEKTLRATLEWLEYIHAARNETGQSVAGAYDPAEGDANRRRLIYGQVFNELALPFRLDVPANRINEERNTAFRRLILTVNLLSVEDLRRIARDLNEPILDAMIARAT